MSESSLHTDVSHETGTTDTGQLASTSIPLAIVPAYKHLKQAKDSQGSVPQLPSHRFQYSVWHDLKVVSIKGTDLKAPRIRDGPDEKEAAFYSLKDEDNQYIHHNLHGRRRITHQTTMENWEQAKRFGTALVPSGQLNLKSKIFSSDFRPIDDKCKCSTCKNYTRAYLHTIVTNETVACHLLSVHNVAYQLNLMKSVHDSIKEDNFPQFIKAFFIQQFPNKDFPQWAIDALDSVNVKLNVNTPDNDQSSVAVKNKVTDSSNIENSKIS
ncbi:queuine tRNA-ribosyltransferase [Mytilus galloprovincialis]|uniref:Queuine tRNA-ribosyltransferase n=1 Tax=Mytilus galloprovincialis TaxID=29158 RepID=A0A8B6FGJ5_MYTGA|nr:queuine tRNA-ribosyltransferase [Mytilus galloprovincialis]